MNTHDSSPRISSETAQADGLGAVLALLLLRIWLGLRALQQGVEKFAGTSSSDEVAEVDGEPNEYGLTDTETEKFYGLGNFHGVPEQMYESFLSEPLIPAFALSIYDIILTPLLIILGITVLLGIAIRTSLFAMGLLYTSLTFGLILLGQDGGIAWLGIHILLVVAALLHVRHNRFSVMKSY